jgi:uncharacterized lipoprotein YajG
MDMKNTFKRLLLILSSGLALAGCAASHTEQTFGDAVRSVTSDQRLVAEVRDDQADVTDGQRLESVMTLHRTMVGDPAGVVRQRVVEQSQ